MNDFLVVLLSAAKHLYRAANPFAWITAVMEMFHRAQQAVLFFSGQLLRLLLPLLFVASTTSAAAQVTNDNIENRRVLRLEEVVSSNTTDCTVQRACVSTMLAPKQIQYHNDQWFEFTPAAPGHYFVNVGGQHCRYLRGIQVVVLTGEPCQILTYQLVALRSLGTQDDVFVPLPHLEAGRRYLLNVDGYAHDLCSFRLQVSRRPKGLPATEAVSSADHTGDGHSVKFGWYLPDSIVATYCQVWRRNAREQTSVLVGRVPVTRNNFGRQESNYSIADTLPISKVSTAYQYRVVAERANELPVLLARHDIAWASGMGQVRTSPAPAPVPSLPPSRAPEAIPETVEISLTAFKPGTPVRVEMRDALSGRVANEESVLRGHGLNDSHVFALRKFFPDGAQSVRLRLSGTRNDGRLLVVDFVY